MTAALFIISRFVAVNVYGTVKFTPVVLSPTCILEVAPLTVQAPTIVGLGLFFIINVNPSVVKLAGGVPDPSVPGPQVDNTSRLPVDLL